jgi:hypothetical protein
MPLHAGARALVCGSTSHKQRLCATGLRRLLVASAGQQMGWQAALRMCAWLTLQQQTKSGDLGALRF